MVDGYQYRVRFGRRVTSFFRFGGGGGGLDSLWLILRNFLQRLHQCCHLFVGEPLAGCLKHLLLVLPRGGVVGAADVSCFAVAGEWLAARSQNDHPWNAGLGVLFSGHEKRRL
jgi:hypothetical protein